MQPSEKKILKGCRNGNPKYQKMLYEAFYGKMKSICLRYSKDSEEARDILQEGFLKVFKNIHKFKGEGSLEGWIRRIVVNTSINYYHKNSKHRNIFSLEDVYHIQESHLDVNNPYVIDDLSYKDLLRLIRSLPPAYQTVFNLYVIEGYNHREIGEMLGISEGTSKSNLAKARMRLKKHVLKLYTSKSRTSYVQENVDRPVFS